jgi:hypothetical protein
MRQMLGWMVGAACVFGQAQLAGAQVAVSVNPAYGVNYGVYGYTTPFGYASGVTLPAPIVGAAPYYAPGYAPGVSYYSSAYRGYTAPVVGVTTGYAASYYTPGPVYYAPVARVKYVRRPFRVFPW